MDKTFYAHLSNNAHYSGEFNASSSIAGQDHARAHRRYPFISIVTTLYRSSPYVHDFIDRITKTLASVNIDSYEIILVDDGSPDDTLSKAIAYAAHDLRIVVIELARNFGHHHAFWAGLHEARGELTFLIDSDMEVAPEELIKFLEIYLANDVDVVYGVQEKRKGGLIERWGGGLFWRMFNHLSDVDLPHDVLTERLMSRNYLDALLRLGDFNLFLAGMMYWTGFKQVPVTIKKQQRDGFSTYTLGRRIQLFVEAVTSFSSIPLKFVLVLGMAISIIAGVLGLWLFTRKVMNPHQVLPGYTSLMLLVLGMGGLIITIMGVFGLYIARIFTQVQGRPTFIVRRTHRSPSAERMP